MQDIDLALAQINEIKSRLAEGAMFRGFGPAVIAGTGGLAILLTLAQHFWPNSYATDQQSFLFFWIALAIIAAGLIGTEMLARSRIHHGGLGDAMIINAITHFLPAGVAGAASCAVLMKFAPHSLWLVPGLWQLFVALGLFSAARTLPRTINLIATWYLVSGVVVLVMGAQTQELSPLMMGGPFGIGQLLMAGVLKLANGGGDVDA